MIFIWSIHSAKSTREFAQSIIYYTNKPQNIPSNTIFGTNCILKTVIHMFICLLSIYNKLFTINKKKIYNKSFSSEAYFSRNSSSQIC